MHAKVATDEQMLYVRCTLRIYICSDALMINPLTTTFPTHFTVLQKSILLGLK